MLELDSGNLVVTCDGCTDHVEVETRDSDRALDAVAELDWLRTASGNDYCAECAVSRRP
jgi:hypothetical protein